jgi:hypothetical protein
MTDLHALIGPVLLLVLVGLAAAGVACAVRGRVPDWLDLGRRIVLGALVAQAAIGLALAVRGDAPREWLHWVYGVAIAAALLVPGMLRPELPEGRRATPMAVGAGLAAIFAWRLSATG